MATFYVDYINGNDSNSGQSWATAFKGTTAALGAKGVVAGDTIRVAKSPDPVNTGKNITFTSGLTTPGAARFMTNFSTVRDATTNRWKVTGIGHGLTTGDQIYISGTSANTQTFSGQWIVDVQDTSVFYLRGSVVTTGTTSYTGNQFIKMAIKQGKLDTPSWKVLDDPLLSWNTNGGSFSGTAPSPHRTGNFIPKRLSYVFPSTTAVNTRYAWKDLGATGVDLSGYTRISFWLYTGAATAATSYKICLCSDQNGQTIVNEFALPAYVSYNTWFPVVLDNGAALGSSIKSIALYTNTTTVSASTMHFDNFTAVKSADQVDAITHNSMLSIRDAKNFWYNVNYFTDEGFIAFDHGTNNQTDIAHQHGEASGTYPLWRREPILTDLPTGITSVAPGINLLLSGSPQLTTTWEGGWDPVSNTRNGETWFDGRRLGVVFSTTNIRYTSYTGFAFSRYYRMFAMNNSSGSYFDIIHQSCISQSPDFSVTNNATMYQRVVINSGSGVYAGGTTNTTYKYDYSWMNSGSSYSGYQNTIIVGSALLNPVAVFSIGAGYENNLVFGDMRFTGTSISVNPITTTTTTGDNYWKFTDANTLGGAITGVIDNATNLLTPAATTNSRQVLTNYTFTTPQVINMINTDGGNFIYGDGYGQNNGMGWRAKILNNTRFINYPLDVRVARIALKANQTTTVKLKVRNGTNTGQPAFGIRGGQIAGIDQDIIVQANAADVTNWQDVVLTLTPTASGVVELTYFYWLTSGAVATSYFDGMEVS